MRRTAKKISLWPVYLVPKSNSSSKLSSVDYWLLSVTTQLNVFKRFRSYAVKKCFIVRCDEHSSLFKTMTMLFKVHITNYNLRPRFFLSLVIQAQADHPLLVGAVVDWNLSNDFLLFIEEIHMNNTVIIICSKMQNLKQIFQ